MTAGLSLASELPAVTARRLRRDTVCMMVSPIACLAMNENQFRQIAITGCKLGRPRSFCGNCSDWPTIAANFRKLLFGQAATRSGRSARKPLSKRCRHRHALRSTVLPSAAQRVEETDEGLHSRDTNLGQEVICREERILGVQDRLISSLEKLTLWDFFWILVSLVRV